MKEVVLICPNCGSTIIYKNWFDWVLHTPFHWFGKRYTKCWWCDHRYWMKREPS